MGGLGEKISGNFCAGSPDARFSSANMRDVRRSMSA